MDKRRGRPSPSMVVALVALFVALTGAAYAVSIAPKNSVVSKSIKNGQVKSPDVANNAVNGSKVADGSLSGADILGNSLTGTQINESMLEGSQIPGLPEVVTSGSANFSSAISDGSCQQIAQVTAGVLSSDQVLVNAGGIDVSSAVALHQNVYGVATAGNVNVYYCNDSGFPVTPGVVSWMVLRG